MHSLVVQTGKHKGRKIDLPSDRQLIIGRDEGCYLRLASSEVSRQHCLMLHTSRGWLLRDMRSQNGTIVNEARITSETFLQPGDTLKIGPMLFQFVGPKSAREAEPGLDADIASWLTEDSSLQDPKMGDTTVIPATVVKAATESIKPPPPSKTEFDSVAEEGHDIIRRFMEVQAARKKATGHASK